MSSLAALEAKLADPLWRLTSGELYKIAPADGSGIIAFRPRLEQIEVLEALIAGDDSFIPKARRLGMSTTLGVYAADCMLFRKVWQGSLVDQNAKDAGIKLDRIVRVALENLPEWLQWRVKFVKSNDSQITISGVGSDNERSFYAGMNARGGSNDFLWVSEWGVIQHEDAKRSAKIRSGALPSARHGLTAIETTWAGGKGGDVWELIEPTLEGEATDWKILFFPWWIDPRNVSETASMDAEAEKYFAEIAERLQKEGIVLSDAQRRWWAQERRKQGIFMKRENPTFLDECWASPIKGAVYAAAIDRARTENRVTRFPVDGHTPVDTFWDLGAPASTVVWYGQCVGREIRLIDCDRGDKGTLIERVSYMKEKGYHYGKHYLPHDCAQTDRTGSTFLGEIAKAGFHSSSLVTVPKCLDVWVGINHLLEMFPSLAFRSPSCDDGLDALACYRTRLEGEGINSVATPVHDWSSHTADALRTMAEAHHAGMFTFKYTQAQPVPDWWTGGIKQRRRGLVPMRVTAG